MFLLILFRNLPFGVQALNPAFTVDTKPLENDDKLYAVSQRFNYSDKSPQRRPTKAQKVKSSRMTVRLRPRQVLCSKCKGICNENSENVDHSRKRKNSSNNSESSSDRPLSRNHAPHHELNTRSQAKEKKMNEKSHQAVNSPPRPLFSDNQNTKRLNPKIPRLHTSNDSDKFVEKSPPTGGSENDDPLALAKDPLDLSDNSNDYSEASDSKKGKSMVLRKKKNVASMEELWNDNEFNENAAAASGAAQPGTISSSSSSVVDGVRTLKISFGRSGEETVLKIPKIDTFEPIQKQAQTSIRTHKEVMRAKAAKRALKKAKKEARRKILVGAGQSPVCNLSGASPRYAIASPRYTIGSTSPRYTISPTESLIPRRHKHKVKHKKKHRDERKHKSVLQEDPLFIPENDTAIKERCLKQKLSISLKRLTENSYSSKCTTNTTSPTTDSSDGGFDDSSEPNFPPVVTPDILQMITDQTSTTMVSSTTKEESSTSTVEGGGAVGFDAEGNIVEVGDIVWGKIHGFPWWPGKVLNILSATCDSGNNNVARLRDVTSSAAIRERTGSVDQPEQVDTPPKAQAHVAWYGSATSSMMPCEHLTPFLENFKVTMVNLPFTFSVRFYNTINLVALDRLKILELNSSCVFVFRNFLF